MECLVSKVPQEPDGGWEWCDGVSDGKSGRLLIFHNSLVVAVEHNRELLSKVLYL